MKRKRIDHADKIYSLYENKGVNAACEYANKHGIEYAHCSPCDADMPSIKGECCICGIENQK